ncbi:MAG: DegT/DnrJ/EryC1/StrS family aminotransferase [Nitrospiraceae bacterium]|nr:DegT/DnrJ/EryC1/StrS family aminotransferase [Nitrospiraceae bacterium]
MIPVFKPKMNKDEILPELEKIFDSGWIGLGPKTVEFEKKFAEFIGTKYALGVNSATAALHLSVHALGLSENDEVIVPSMTFVSTALAPLYCGAKVVFADVEEDTLCIDPVDIEKKITARTKAIIPVHFGGHACRMDEIMDIANRHKLAVIEDVAHGCGGKYKGKMLGSIGVMGCFSFHAVKNLPLGDGGMITMNDEELFKKLQRLRWVGINKDTWNRSSGGQYSWQYSVDELGFKCHMNDIMAVIGLAQLKVLNEHNEMRRRIALHYNEELARIPWITRPVEKDYTRSAWHNYVVKVPFRNELNEFLRIKGISTGVHYEPINHYGVFKGMKADVPVIEKVWEHLLTLPLYPDLSELEIEQIVEAIKEFGVEKGL